ncbi:hypothetical protein DFS34DRAFT_590951 [Phlyctochytrium arcticum]|nr:hypothetical protein DFS34DRAFT_590951 [Phlyctochytrium arcticum]
MASISKTREPDLSLKITSLAHPGLDKRFSGKEFVQYHGSLVGKDFRAFAQVAIFAFDGFVDQKWMEAWRAAAVLVQMCWVGTIDSLEHYEEDLRTAIDTMLVKA